MINMATIATQNGTTLSREHNIRDKNYVSVQKHIDPTRSHLNRIWIDVEPEKAYEMIFGEALREYNQGLRKDRQIENYYQKIKDARIKELDDIKANPTYVDKKGKVVKRKPKTQAPVQEMIIGVYPDKKKNEKITYDQSKKICKEFLDNFREKYPNMVVIGAYFHADEQGEVPHMHLDYVTVANDYKRGLSKQVSSSKAYKQTLEYLNTVSDNFKFSKGLTTQILFEQLCNQDLEDICLSNGVENIEHPQKGKGAHHLHKKAYIAKQELSEVLDDLKVLELREEQLTKELKRLKRLALLQRLNPRQRQRLKKLEELNKQLNESEKKQEKLQQQLKGLPEELPQNEIELIEIENKLEEMTSQAEQLEQA